MNTKRAPFPILTTVLILLALLGCATLPSSPPCPPPSPPKAPPQAQPAWLGIFAGKNSGPEVLVGRIMPGSPADLMGLQKGDQLLRLDGKDIPDFPFLAQTIRKLAQGDKVVLSIKRGAQTLDLQATLAPRPPLDDLARSLLVDKLSLPLTVQTWVSGHPTSLDALKGKVVLLEFWSPWCGPCKAASPRLAQWQKKLGPQGLQIVSIALADSDAQAITTSRLPPPFPVALDQEEGTAESYLVAAIPTYVVIDRKSHIREVFAGTDFLEKVEDKIQTCLAEKP